MSDVLTDIAVRGTLLHYAQLSAQMQREAAKESGDMLWFDQCRKCGLYHASAPCHPYMARLGLVKVGASKTAAKP